MSQRAPVHRFVPVAPTDGSWWIAKSREELWRYASDPVQQARMSGGRCGSFVGGHEGFGSKDRLSAADPLKMLTEKTR